MPEPTPAPVPINDRLTALEARVFVLEQKPGELARLRARVRGGVAAAWPAVKHWAPWVLVAFLLMRGGSGCEIPWPTPGPGPEPAPDPKAPLRVMLVYDSANMAKLPAAQLEAMQALAVWKYLDEKCAVGRDGMTPERRKYDMTADVSQESKEWQDLFARKRDTLPWLVVERGPVVYEGPEPKTLEDKLALLKKYGG